QHNFIPTTGFDQVGTTPAIGPVGRLKNAIVYVGYNGGDPTGGYLYIVDAKTKEQVAVYSTVLSSLFAGPAIADINGDKQNEILVVGKDLYLRAFDDSATVLWTSTVLGTAENSSRSTRGPSVADIDNDGKAEI